MEIYLELLPSFTKAQAGSTSNLVEFEVMKKLWDEQFTQKVKHMVETCQPLWSFIKAVSSKVSTLADAVELWLELPAIYKSNRNWYHSNNLMLSDAGLIANSLDPRYRGQKLPVQQKKAANALFLDILQDQELLAFIDHRDSKSSFANEKLKLLSPENYWSFHQNEYKDLAALGLKYASLPASLYSYREANLNDSVSLTKSQSDKLKYLSKALNIFKTK